MAKVARIVQFILITKWLEEDMEKQVNDGTFDECAYVKDDDDL